MESAWSFKPEEDLLIHSILSTISCWFWVRNLPHHTIQWRGIYVSVVF